MYVVLLLISVLYRFALNSGFSGDPIALGPGVPTANNVAKRSDTHFITLQSEFETWVRHNFLFVCVSRRRTVRARGFVLFEAAVFCQVVLLRSLFCNKPRRHGGNGVP